VGVSQIPCEFWSSQGTRLFYLRQQSFILLTACLAAVVTPALTFLLRPLTLGLINYVPAGPTGIVFAILAQYHAMIPHIYKYRLALSTSAPNDNHFVGLTFSDKSYRYLLALQLALFQWPGSLLAAAVGWVVGHAWRNGVLPGSLTTWRVPGWMVGIRGPKRTEEFEGLRRRLEGENSAAATGMQTLGQEATGRRRTTRQQLFDQFRGAL